MPVTKPSVDLYSTNCPTLILVTSPCFEYEYDKNESDDGIL